MGFTIERPDGEAILASVLVAPVLSMAAALFGALILSLPEIISAFAPTTFFTSLVQSLVAVVLMGLLVTVWGVIPSAVFGLAGVVASERWLKSTVWWMWGLAGLATSAVYVAASLVEDRLALGLGFFMAPWIYLSRYGGAGVSGDPALPLSSASLMTFIPCILIAGFGAGVVYFLISRKRFRLERG